MGQCINDTTRSECVISEFVIHSANMRSQGHDWGGVMNNACHSFHISENIYSVIHIAHKAIISWKLLQGNIRIITNAPINCF